MQCPKCGSSAPSDAVECPICFAPLGAPDAGIASGPAVGGFAPPAMGGPALPREEDYMPVAGIPGLDNVVQPEPPMANYLTGNVPQAGGYPQPMSMGETRVSLTGEVIPVAAPSIQPQGPGPATLRPPVSAPARPAPAAARRVPREQSAPAEKSGSPVALIAVILLLIIGGGAAGWWFWQQKQAPAKAADAFMQSFQKKDWKTMYSLIELPAAAKSMTSEQQFTMGMNMVGGLINLKEYRIGEVTREGDTAKVKVSATVELTSPIGGQQPGARTSTQDMPMRKVDGKWKVDATTGLGAGLPMGGIGQP